MIHSDIESVINAIEIHSYTEYTINGVHRDLNVIRLAPPPMDPPANFESSSTKKLSPAELIYSNLATDIYTQLYQNSTDINIADNYEFLDFTSKLSMANSGNVGWENGWTIVGEEKDKQNYIVRKGNAQFWIGQNNVLINNSSKCKCAIRIPKDAKNQQHYYIALGETPPEQEEKIIIRLYWNLTPSSSISYIQEITRRMNNAEVPFKTMVLSDPKKYTRSDSGVLYIDEIYLKKALPLVVETHAALAQSINKNTPLFTKYIREGLGLAEDTNNGRSFGFSRSCLLAKAILKHFQKEKDRNSLGEYIIKEFEKEGIDTQSPYAARVNITQYEDLIALYS